MLSYCFCTSIVDALLQDKAPLWRKRFCDEACPGWWICVYLGWEGIWIVADTMATVAITRLPR